MFRWLRDLFPGPRVRERDEPAAPRILELSVTLDRASTIGGLELPAGATVDYWETEIDASALCLCQIELPATAGVTHGGVVLPPGSSLHFSEKGELSHGFVEEAWEWLGVPCSGLTVLDWASSSWRLEQTVLDRDHAFGAATYARGTKIELDEHGAVRASSWPPIAAPPGYDATMRGLYPAGSPDPETWPVSQGESGREDETLLGPVFGESYLSDPSVRTLADLRRHYPPEPGIELHVSASGQPVAVRTRDGACFSVLVEEGMMTFNEWVLEDGKRISATTEIERVEATPARRV